MDGMIGVRRGVLMPQANRLAVAVHASLTRVDVQTVDVQTHIDENRRDAMPSRRLHTGDMKAQR